MGPQWPVAVAIVNTYGTKRYLSVGCSSSALTLPKPKQKQKGCVEHAALAADAPQQAPGTGGASGSADVPPYILSNLQAARLSNQASWVGHTT